MPVITFSPADILSTTLLEKGYYTAIVKEISGATASGSGKSVTYWVTLEITDGPATGKEIKIAFNTGTKGRSILGDTQWAPAPELRVLFNAITGSNIGIENPTFDTDDMIGIPFDLPVTVEAIEGDLKNGISNSYLPYGKSKEKPAF